MREEPPTSQGYSYLKLMIGAVIGVTGSLLLCYLWYGPESFFSHFLMSMFALLGALLFLKVFKPKTSQPVIHNDPD
jgi:hypothetical protein